MLKEKVSGVCKLNSSGHLLSSTMTTNGSTPKRSIKIMQRLTIPVFSGLIREYATWIAAFNASIGKADAEEEEKCLHLSQYLKGEPLDMISPLGYSAEVYTHSLKLLDERYGGELRQYEALTEDVRNFRPAIDGDLAQLERFVNLLSILVVTFGKHEE